MAVRSSSEGLMKPLLLESRSRTGASSALGHQVPINLVEEDSGRVGDVHHWVVRAARDVNQEVHSVQLLVIQAIILPAQEESDLALDASGKGSELPWRQGLPVE